MPVLVAGMTSKTWKIKATCIDLLRPCLQSMNAATPTQLSQALPEIVTKLAEAALEVRAEVRASCKSVLSLIGGMVSSPEISKLSEDLVTALSEPTNQKRTQEVLARMGNQTFMSLIDAASLALLMPIVVRGLRSQEGQSKKWSAQIFGSVAMLVKDAQLMQPYLKAVLPLLQELLTDPVAEVQREAAKAFGVLEQVMPDFSWTVTTPWLFQKMGNGNQGEQIGAALALAEVLTKMEKGRKLRCDALIPEIQAGALHEKWNFKRGYLELLDAAPQAMKMAFTPYIASLFPACLMGITGDRDPVEDPAFRAATAIVARFGDLCPELLLPAMEGVYLSTLSSTTPEEQARFLIVREKNATLIAKTAEKILEHKKFGQDLLTTEECSTRETREYILGLIFALRFDPEAAVKRVANGCYKSSGGAPKVLKAMSVSLQEMMLKWRSGECGAGAQRVATEVLGVLAESGDCEAPTDDMPEAKAFRFPEPQAKVKGANGEDAAAIATGSTPPSLSEASTDASSGQGGRANTASAVQDFLESESHFNTLPADVKHHCSQVARSVTIEAQNQKMSGKKLTSKLLEELKFALEPVRSCFAQIDDQLPSVCEAVARAALGEGFSATEGGVDDSEEVLLHVENLLLMYGAGHLLLRDTTLDMKKNQRYGVVGENGAGKTTLMKEIANHRIVNMPQDLKCIHVDDSKLGLMSKSALSALEYAMKMGNDIGVTTASEETLKEVGFSSQMCKDPVSELSTGWRMRLTLGVNMLKHADLVLLDEPTNHLDEESVDWLADYILSIHESSVMVISHEPKFLNKICTHVIAYVDKKLEYSVGNFDAFAASKGLSKDQIHSMLSGNLSFNTKTQEELEAEERGEVVAKVAAPVAGPPKLSFPIAGSMDGVKSASKSVLELKNVSFRYGADKEYLVNGCSAKLSLNSRVAICGRNGCGKSTLMTLLCSEMGPSEGKDGALGEVWRHQNLRLGYLKQDHLKALGPFFDTSPFVYITSRFKDGYDGDLQKRLIEPEDDEDAARRAKLAKQYGKYGNPVGELVSRSTTGKTLMYEVAWEGLDDPKQNTMESISKLKQMGLDKVIIACDERIAAKAAGLDQRPLTRREVVKHCEAFGIDEEMCCNRQVRGFSAGQKVRLSLAAMFWTKPHLIAVDEPTNYLDVETVEALAKALTNFRGGIVMIEPKTEFVERICNERWNMEDGIVTIEKMDNKNKRQA
jgi:ATPase subunit of ABC transporter with duplicated ATPase domains